MILRKRISELSASGSIRWFLFCCGLAVVPPLVVHWLYALGFSDPLIVSPWSAGDMLAYCGAFGGAVIAMLGVYWSLKASGQDLERQTRDEAAPFFSVVFLEQMNKRDPVAEMFVAASRGRLPKEAVNVDDASQTRTKDYEETERRSIYAIMDGDIVYRTGLTGAQQEYACSRNLKQKVAAGTTAIVPNPIIYIPIRLMNVGKGAAVGARIGVYPAGSEWAGVMYWTVGPGDYVYLGVYVDTAKEAVLGEYELGIVYYDCLGCQYIQKFDLNVVREGEDNHPAVQMAYYGQRSLLSDEERERMLKNEEVSSRAVFI